MKSATELALELDSGAADLNPGAAKVPVVRATGGDRISESGRNKNKSQVKASAGSDSLRFTGGSNIEALADNGKRQRPSGQAPLAPESNAI